MPLITKFGKLTITKGATEDPRDFWIDITHFEFDDESAEVMDKIRAVLKYVEEKLVEALHTT